MPNPKAKPKKLTSNKRSEARTAPSEQSDGAFVLNAETGAAFPVANLEELVLGVISLAQAMAERKFYPYQVQFAYRFVESLLLRDGATVTALLARQAGKTEALGAVLAALLVVLPILARQFPKDWRFNLTDNEGRYRGFKDGVKIGIYAPKQSQAEIMYSRVKLFMDTKTARRILSEAGIDIEVSNGDTLRTSNGSRLLCQTASDKAKIEGETHHLLVLEEAQDIGESKIKKSLSPMVAATRGSTVMIGTSSTQKCVFYDIIKQNERAYLAGLTQNHFQYNWRICAQYNSLYYDYVLSEMVKLGANSDEFRMSYDIEWLFERGMFVSQQLLLSPSVALQQGELFSSVHFSPEAVRNGYQVVAGIDWGRDHDSTVVTLVAVDWANPVQTLNTSNERGNYTVELFRRHLLCWKEWQGDNYEYQFQEIMNLLRMWRGPLRRVVTDSTGPGAPMYDRLVASLEQDDVEVVPLTFSPQAKSDLFKAFYAEICGGRFTFPANKAVRQLTEFRKFTNQMLDLTKNYKSGLMVVAHPDEKHAHDDYPDSAALAVWGTLTRPVDSEVDFSEHNYFFRR